MAAHAERRAHEMDEAAATLAELGVEAVVARAAAERLHRCVAAGVQGAFGGGPAPERYQEVVAAPARPGAG